MMAVTIQRKDQEETITLVLAQGLGRISSDQELTQAATLMMGTLMVRSLEFLRFRMIQMVMGNQMRVTVPLKLALLRPKQVMALQRPALPRLK